MALSWKTLEYPEHKKTVDWYWSVASIGLGGVIVSLIVNNILFALFLALGTGLLIAYAQKKPDYITVSLNETGMTYAGVVHPWEHITGYMIAEEILYVELEKSFFPVRAITIEGVSTEAVASYMKEKSIEKEIEVPFIQKLIDTIGL